MKSSKRKNGRVGSSEIASLLSDGLIAPQSSRRTRTPTTSLQTFGEILANPTRTLRSDRAASRNSSSSSSADTDSAPPEQRRRTTAAAAAAAAAAPQPQHRDELVVLQEREKACTAYIDDLRSLVQRMQKDIEQLEARRTALEAAFAAATTADAAASAPPPPPPPPASSVAASPPAPEPAASTPAAAATEAAETPAQVAEPSSG